MPNGEDTFATLPEHPTPTSNLEEKAEDALASAPAPGHGAGTKRKLSFSRASSNNSLGSCTLSSGSGSAPSQGMPGKRGKMEPSTSEAATPAAVSSTGAPWATPLRPPAATSSRTRPRPLLLLLCPVGGCGRWQLPGSGLPR